MAAVIRVLGVEHSGFSSGECASSVRSSGGACLRTMPHRTVPATQMPIAVPVSSGCSEVIAYSDIFRFIVILHIKWYKNLLKLEIGWTAAAIQIRRLVIVQHHLEITNGIPLGQLAAIFSILQRAAIANTT